MKQIYEELVKIQAALGNCDVSATLTDKELHVDVQWKEYGGYMVRHTYSRIDLRTSILESISMTSLLIDEMKKQKESWLEYIGAG